MDNFVWVLIVTSRISGWLPPDVSVYPQPDNMTCGWEAARIMRDAENGTVAACTVRSASEAPPHPESWRFK